MTWKATSTTINKSGAVFEDALRLLSAPGAGDMYSVQGKVARGLYQLAVQRSQLVAERKRLVREKSRMKPEWFRGRLAHLAMCVSAVERADGVGRSVGDAFAWLLYANDHALLREHLALAPNRVFPTAVGGEAEVLFFSQVARVSGLYPLAHNVTTFLRKGDFSLVDTAAHAVRGIGEIKAGVPQATLIPVHAQVVGDARLDEDLQRYKSAPHEPSLAELPNVEILQQQQDALRRQMAAASGMLQRVRTGEAVNRVPGYTLLDVNAQLLRETIAKAEKRGSHLEHAAEGLVVAAYSHGHETLAARIRAPTPTHRIKDLAPVERIMTRNTQQDFVVVTRIHYLDNGWPRCDGRLPPTMWWLGDAAATGALAFHRVVALTIFNVAALLAALRTRGYKTTIIPLGKGKLPRFAAVREANGRRFGSGDLTDFIELCTNYCIGPESAADLLVRANAHDVESGHAGEGALDLLWDLGLTASSG